MAQLSLHTSRVHRLKKINGTNKKQGFRPLSQRCQLFDLFVILAICIYVIPGGESRTINRPAVFLITAVGSVF